MIIGSFLCKFVIVPIFFTIAFCRPDQKDKTSIELYYSALDSESAQFLKDQLKETILSVLLKYVNVYLFPFAGCKRDKSAGKIVCRLGTEEVRANFYHLCAFYQLHKSRPPTSKLSFTFNAIMYALCTTDKVAEYSKIGKVVKKLELIKCAKYIKGMEEKVEKCVFKEDDNLINDVLRKYELSHIVSYPIIISNDTLGKVFNITKKNSFWEQFCDSLGPAAPLECDESDDDEKNQTSNTPTFTIGYYYRTSPYGFIIILVILMLL